VRSTLTQDLLRHIRREGLFRPGQRVGVAVSGGADSVALLRLLLDLRDALGIVLSLVHFNHKLRGKASDSDELFVTRLAEKFGLPLHLGHADIAAKARREKANLEDASRRARYSFFEKLVNQRIVDIVATAHSSDDQAETVLSHLLRGTGLAGLGAIHPRTPCAVRPLLPFRRAALRSFLRARKQSWREDLTNLDISRLRARIRKKLLPLLEKQFQPNVVAHLATLARLAREDDALLSALAQQRCAQIARQEKDVIRIPVADLIGPRQKELIAAPDLQKLEKTPEVLPALAARVIRLVAEKIRNRPGQWNAQHVQGVLELARRGQNGKLLQLPGGIDVRRDHDSLIFCKRAPLKNKY
jgi:tRNA(Ile)-lysidine synthase